jgi:hypothetical protein
MRRLVYYGAAMQCAESAGSTCDYYYQYLRPCGNWKCAHCSVLTQRIWTSRIEIGVWQHVSSGGSCRLITLTLPGKTQPRVDYLFQRFAVLRRNLDRSKRFGPWARGVGLGKSRRPHLHLIELSTGQMSNEDLQHRMQSAGFGNGNPRPIVSVGTTKDDVRQLAAYVTREAIVVATTWTDIGGSRTARPIAITWGT